MQLPKHACRLSYFVYILFCIVLHCKQGAYSVYDVRVRVFVLDIQIPLHTMLFILSERCLAPVSAKADIFMYKYTRTYARGLQTGVYFVFASLTRYCWLSLSLSHSVLHCWHIAIFFIMFVRCTICVLIPLFLFHNFLLPFDVIEHSIAPF